MLFCFWVLLFWGVSLVGLLCLIVCLSALWIASFWSLGVNVAFFGDLGCLVWVIRYYVALFVDFVALFRQCFYD